MIKITEAQLRKIVRQEILREAEDAAASAKGEKIDTKGQLNTKEIAAQLNMDEPTLKIAVLAAKKDDVSKGKALLAFVKALLAAGPVASKNVGTLMSKIEEK
jgi:DNA-binding CsgD family transcriptional regulator